MKWFQNVSTRSKLFLGFGIVVAMLVVISVISKTGLSSIEGSQKIIFEKEFVNSTDLLRLKAKYDEIRMALLSMMSAPDQGVKERWHQNIKTNAEEIAVLMAQLEERNRDNPFIMQKLGELNSARQAFRETRDNKLIPLIYEGKMEEARQLATGIQAERYERIRSITAELVKGAEDNARRHISDSERLITWFTNLLLVISGIAVLTGIIMGSFMNRIIASPLREIADVAEKIASGDLSANPPSDKRRDEVGILSRAFRTMIEQLRKQLQEIAAGVNVLASSSNQIAASITQLASSTEETAVAVTQTTTTVEEVKQTVHVSSQKAKYVSETAQNAAQVSNRGTGLVNETIEGVNNIQQQMEYIAETIVKLSEHNQVIGEIIAAVDDISEQANLLAVNASIEASKAGEYGKGFLVVAQEIKNLAEQAKQATKQVRTILSDIQKTSSSAVMVTEKGIKAVESSVKQSADTGEAIRELSRSIAESSQAVMQIAASSQQQLAGMDQVVMAMSSIKQATTQNAASTKQAETAVKNLQDLGQNLKRLVGYYKI